MSKIADSFSSAIISGMHSKTIFYLTMLHILWIAIKTYRNPLASYKALKKLMRKRNAVHGHVPIRKYVKSGKRYFWGLNAPGWPSLAFNRFIENELQREHSRHDHTAALQTMVFAVTAKCPLQCEHCFEWNNLDSTEPLTLDELKQILSSFQQRGVLQVQLSGGEPISRFDDTIELLKSAQPGTDFWLLTSGFGLTFEKAITLKQAGLTGVNISLDHWQQDAHNAFRKNDHAFQWVQHASAHCRNADLVLAFSLCATKEFVSPENLEKYLALATEFGAGFVQILEPRQAGHFSGRDVNLQAEHMQMLEDFYIRTNDNAASRHAPIITYPGYHQRRLGCFGAGNRYLYVDALGDLHACPFCQRNVGNALRDSIDAAVNSMRRIGCHTYEMVSE